MAEENSFLGKGWSFPPTFDNLNAQVAMLQAEDDIKSSLQILLSTALGERVMQPKFGCNMDEMVFENLDTTLKTEMKNRVETAILYFEPRIDLQNVELTQIAMEGLVSIDINYLIRATNTRGNLVFPFYLSEV